MKKIILSIILFFSTLMVVDATSMSNMDVDVYIDSNGNANFKEIWTINTTQDRELYHSYRNISGFEFSNLSVFMDNKKFETVSNWNRDASFEEKAYKAGLNYLDDGVEICFGISEYGKHTYVVSYTVDNFILKLNDSDMLYWEFIPRELSWNISNVNIKIYSDFKFDNNLDVWGYGKYASPCYVSDGVIEMTSDGSTLNKGEYLTILAKFPKDTFSSNHILDSEFSQYYDMAQEGATTYIDKKSIFDIIMPIITGIIYFIPFIIMFIVALFTAKKNNNVRFGSAGNKVKKDVPNFREIPCNKDLFRAYWVANNYNLSEKKEDFLGSVILKWLRDGNVKIEKVTKNGLFKEKEDTNIVFEKEPDGIELENQLYNYMFTASGDGKLESGEFKKWCSNHYSKILKWFVDVLEYENKMLVTDGKAQIVTDGKVFKHDVYQIDDSMMIDAEQMAGLKKFLKEFSMIKEREAIEVHLWNEYLMYAQIFGIADEVASQFKKLYPEVIQEMESMGYGYSDVIFIHSISSDGIKSATSAREKAQAYTAGGGGFSAGGGGGGAFGGGGGMGSR